MRNKKQSISIVPRGAAQPCVAECAAAGEACSAVNVRECDDALHVVGSPSPIGTIPTGHRLLLVDGNRHITVSGQQVMCEGQVITTLDGELVGAHRIGPDAAHAPSVAVCRAVKGAKPGLSIAPPVFLNAGGAP